MQKETALTTALGRTLILEQELSMSRAQTEALRADLLELKVLGGGGGGGR
jgi:hypothetical protein